LVYEKRTIQPNIPVIPERKSNETEILKKYILKKFGLSSFSEMLIPNFASCTSQAKMTATRIREWINIIFSLESSHFSVAKYWLQL